MSSSASPDRPGDEVIVDEVIVLAGGDAVGPSTARLVPPAGFVIAADSGVAQAAALKLRVDVIVGDFDSADPAQVARAVDDGAELIRYPEDKDATDLELALDVALAREAQRITIVGGGGGRLDHALGNLFVLASPRYARCGVRAVVADGVVVSVVHGGGPLVTLTGTLGELVSLIPAFGPAGGVHTTGLRWALTGDDLSPDSSRGISNEFVDTEATVRADDGVLLVVQPGE